MGYESKIIIVDRRENECPNGNKWVHGSEIVRFDMSKMGYEKYPVYNYDDRRAFRDLFTIPVDFDLYVNQESKDEVPPPEFYREDCYGEICKYTTDIDAVIAWLRQSEAHDHYRRAALLLDFLVSLRQHTEDWTQLAIVHYGY